MITTGNDNHSKRRLFRVVLTGFVTLFSRGTATLLNLLLIPFTSHYLGKERFGLWLLLSSFIAWVSIADLGLTNSLVNAIARADGKNDTDQARESVASAFWIVTPIALFAVPTILTVIPLVPLHHLLGLKSSKAIDEVGPSVIIFLLYCAIRIPTSIVSCIYHAYQEGYLQHLWNLIGGLASAAGLLLAIYFGAGLPLMAGSFISGMLLVDFASALYLFLFHRRYLFPAPGFFNRITALDLIKSGFQFWIAQISSVLLLQTGLVIVSIMYSASEVAAYGTMLRLFALVGAVQTAFVSPLWAAYGEALSRKDVRWIKNVFYKSLLFTLSWMIPSCGIVFYFLNTLFSWMLTEDIIAVPALGLPVMFGEIIGAVSRCISTFLNGLGIIKLQSIIGPVVCVGNLILTWFLGRKFGPQGIAWSTAISMLFLWPVVMGYQAKYAMDTMSSH
ncbi:MAG: oligosaccharide flippase family protein [Blastocatellales bacterium]